MRPLDLALRRAYSQGVTALIVALLASFAAEQPAEVLHRTAAIYEKARSFEFSASLTVSVPGQDVVITLKQTGVYATAAMLPPDAPVPLLELGTVGGLPVYHDRAGHEVHADLGGFVIRSFPFLSLDAVDKLLISVHALPDETLDVGGESLPCAVVEALYERRTPFDAGSGRPVRLWIEKKTYLVRQAMYEREWRGGDLAQWIARVEKITFDQPPPPSAIEQAAMFKGSEEPKWVGQVVPDVTLKSLDGQTVALRATSGRTLVLAFWATWCGPCREEMPLLEKLREEMGSKGVEIWGVTDETPDVARRWLAERKRTLATLVDADRMLFRHYSIERIPVLMIVRGDGKVSTYVVGLCGERDLRADIAKAMDYEETSTPRACSTLPLSAACAPHPA